MSEATDRLTKLEEQAAIRARTLAQEFKEKVDRVRDGIHELEAKKRGISRGRVSKAEAVAAFKADWRAGYKQWVEDFLHSHLATYQQQVKTLGNIDHFMAHATKGVEWFAFLLFGLINEAAIDRAGESLPEGLNEKERTKRIEELDKEIRKLESDMENLLK